jgi:hypothetical protein
MTNTTITGNSAAHGSAVYLAPGNASLLASTVAGNTGAGSLQDDYSRTDEWTIGQTILAGDVGCALFSFSVNDTGYNITDQSGRCLGGSATDVTNADLKLDPAGLAGNGGPAKTIALEPGSPAIDAIPASSGLCQATDQRGNTRPDEAGEASCDIGAYESDYIATTTTLDSSVNPSVSGSR